jgi:hypothetical protein
MDINAGDQQPVRASRAPVCWNASLYGVARTALNAVGVSFTAQLSA